MRIGQLATVVEAERDVPLEGHEVSELLRELLRAGPPANGALPQPDDFDRWGRTS
jgi:hypothetical protein